MRLVNRMLNALEKRIGHWAVPNVTLGLIIGQVVIYILAQDNPAILENAVLVPRLVLEGQVWRLMTFLFVPPMMHVLFAFFFWYLFYLMGTALEQQWGSFRYNLYLLLGTLATVGVSFLVPDVASSNGYLQGTVFLGFAYLFPTFVLHLFLIFPVQIRWLALLTWILYGYQFITGDWLTRLLVFASVSNFLLFFGSDIWQRIYHGHRRMTWQAKTARDRKQPRHQCMVCGVTDISHPKLAFRYCSECAGQCGYCPEHLDNHEHVTEPATADQA